MGGEMKKKIEDIRREWAKRPVTGPDPHEVEKRFPDRDFPWAESERCTVSGCHGRSFRGTPYCEEHHLQAIKEKAAEVEEAEKDRVKKQKSAKWQEEQAQARVRSTNTTCSNCSIYLRFAERHVVLKEKGKIPRKPQNLMQKYEVKCEHCK